VLYCLVDYDYTTHEAVFCDLVVIDYENLLNNFVFTDEASLHMCRYDNRHNYRMWAEDGQLQPPNGK